MSIINISLLVSSEKEDENTLSSVKRQSVVSSFISFGAAPRISTDHYHELNDLSPRLLTVTHRLASRVLGFTRTVDLKHPLVSTLTFLAASV